MIFVIGESYNAADGRENTVHYEYLHQGGRGYFKVDGRRVEKIGFKNVYIISHEPVERVKERADVFNFVKERIARVVSGVFVILDTGDMVKQVTPKITIDTLEFFRDIDEMNVMLSAIALQQSRGED